MHVFLAELSLPVSESVANWPISVDSSELFQYTFKRLTLPSIQAFNIQHKYYKELAVWDPNCISMAYEPPTLHIPVQNVRDRFSQYTFQCLTTKQVSTAVDGSVG